MPKISVTPLATIVSTRASEGVMRWGVEAGTTGSCACRPRGPPERRGNIANDIRDVANETRHSGRSRSSAARTYRAHRLGVGQALPVALEREHEATARAPPIATPRRTPTDQPPLAAHRAGHADGRGRRGLL